MLVACIHRCYNFTMAQEIENLLAEAAEKIKREAYNSGWRDAMTAVSQALSGLAPDPDNQNGDLSGPLFIPTASRQDNDMPTTGSTPYYVVAAVRRKPGMTTKELVDSIIDEGHNVPDNSIRTSIYRMKDRRLIVARHNKWFPQ
jgi:hypothetical protein